MSGKGKRTLLLCSLLLAVVGAGYANYVITSGGFGAEITPTAQQQTAQKEEEGQDVFAAFKEERETTRTQEMSYIDSVISSAETDEKTKNEAQSQKLSLAANMESELLTEGVIKTKLGVNAVVTVKEGAVNVVVDKTELSDSEVAQIADIVMSQTDEAASNIKIMPKV